MVLKKIHYLVQSTHALLFSQMDQPCTVLQTLPIDESTSLPIITYDHLEFVYCHLVDFGRHDVHKDRQRSRRAKGAFSEVFVARLSDGTRAIVKELSITNPIPYTHLAKDGAILAQLVHPNIVRTIAASIHPTDCSPPFIVMECCGVPLVSACFVSPVTYFPTTEAKCRAAYEIASGLAYLHYRGIDHYDISPTNIMISTNNTVKIINIGLASVICADYDIPYPPDDTFPLIGTMGYIAPENHTRRREHAVPSKMDPYAFMCDMYSYGCILYGLFTCTSTFSREMQYPPGEHFPPLSRAVPPAIYRIIEQCRDHERIHRTHARDVVTRIEHIIETQQFTPIYIQVPDEDDTTVVNVSDHMDDAMFVRHLTLQHKNIAVLLGITPIRQLVFERVPESTVADLLHPHVNNPFPVLYQIIRAIGYLHYRSNQVVVGGLSAQSIRFDHTSQKPVLFYVGNRKSPHIDPLYDAPEIKAVHTRSTDMYAFGILMRVMYTNASMPHWMARITSAATRDNPAARTMAFEITTIMRTNSHSGF